MSEAEVAFATATEQARRFRTGELSPVELVSIYLDRIERFDHDLSSFITVLGERALEEARRAAADFATGRWFPPLHGIPFAVKDQMLVEGARLTGGSRVLTDRVADRSATVVQRLRDSGAILLGTLNTHEFHSGPTRAFPFGLPRNPWDRERTPGASSCGSAAAVAAGLCTFSLGGDTGGSIRGPASFCGVVGLKPTWSRVSRDGVIPLARSLDAVGPLARGVDDIARVLEAIAGPDLRDPTSSQRPVPAYGDVLGEGVAGLRVGVVEEMVAPGTMSDAALAATHAAVAILRDLGAQIGRASIPTLATTKPLTSVLVMGEAASHHRTWLLSAYDRYDTNTRVGFLTGAILPTGTYLQAARMRSLVTSQVMACFEDFDILVGPSADAAPLLSDVTGRSAAAPAMTTRKAMPQTQVYNLAGNPAMSVPSGYDDDGLPLGMQIAARPFDEATVLRVGHALETHRPWAGRRPVLLGRRPDGAAPHS